MSETPKSGGELFIVDNSDNTWKGLKYLQDWTEIASAFDIASGYFEIGALLALDGKWQKLDKIRILMGDEATARTRQAIFQGLRQNVCQKLDESLENEKEANDLLTGAAAIVLAMQEGKIQCRVYAKRKFHAKAYITHPRVAVIGSVALVGSSNFTVPGLTQNIELNIQIRAPGDVSQLQQWYEKHWEEAEEITPEVIKVTSGLLPSRSVILKRNPGLKLPKILVAKRDKAEGEEVDLPSNEFFVLVLDIATGTGTFLVETIEVIFQHLQAKWAKHGLQGMPVISHTALRLPQFKDYWNAYRCRYAEFLKMDFLRLPLTGNLELFGGLARLGRELTALHLLESPKLETPITEYIGARSPVVEKISWSKNSVWLDKPQTTGFKGVREDVWNFRIGGYQVCEKWLKDRKGRNLSADDRTHYQKIIVALSETIRIMAEIDTVIEKYGGWPLK